MGTLVPTVVDGPHGESIEAFNDENGRLLMSSKQCGEMLEYTKASERINDLFRKHQDEFEEGFTHANHLHRESRCNSKGRPSSRYFTLEGLALICMFSEQPVAKKVRKWARHVIAEIWEAGHYTEPGHKDAQDMEALNKLVKLFQTQMGLIETQSQQIANLISLVYEDRSQQRADIRKLTELVLDKAKGAREEARDHSEIVANQSPTSEEHVSQKKILVHRAKTAYKVWPEYKKSLSEEDAYKQCAQDHGIQPWYFKYYVVLMEQNINSVLPLFVNSGSVSVTKAYHQLPEYEREGKRLTVVK